MNFSKRGHRRNSSRQSREHGFFRIIFLWLVFALIHLTCSTVHARTIIRFATVAPDGSAWMDVMRALDGELREQSRGEVEFKFYPNMTMGDEKDIVRKMRLGQIQSAGFTGSNPPP